jgi:hypothetical protein
MKDFAARRKRLLKFGFLGRIGDAILERFPHMDPPRLETWWGDGLHVEYKFAQQAEVGPLLKYLRELGLKCAKKSTDKAKGLTRMHYGTKVDRWRDYEDKPHNAVRENHVTVVASKDWGEGGNPTCAMEEVGVRQVPLTATVCRDPEGRITEVNGMPVAEYRRKNPGAVV